MSKQLLILLGVLTLPSMICDRLDYEDTATQKGARYQLEAFSAALKKYASDTGNIPDETCGLSSFVENCNSQQGWRGLWVIRTQSALGIKNFRSVLLAMLRGVMVPPIDHAEAV